MQAKERKDKTTVLIQDVKCQSAYIQKAASQAQKIIMKKLKGKTTS